VYVKYVRNLDSILAELREKHPNVEIESCSGGGACVDLGIMRLTDEVWPSDNTDPFDRLSIQDGFTYAYGRDDGLGDRFSKLDEWPVDLA
jgi:alpha-galactosidase